MNGRVATIVRCSDLLRHVYATVVSIERQIGGAGEIVLVTDESTPRAGRSWVSEFARRRGHAAAHAERPEPGRIRNAGIRASESPYVVCVEAGDRLDPRFHERAAAKLEADSGVDVVTSWIQVLGPGSDRQIVVPQGHDLDAAIGDTDAIHSASMFRRSAWASFGGFDDTLPSLEYYDFWLRLLHAGRRAALVESPLLLRVLYEDALYRRAWDRARHVEALERIVAKHTTLFARDPASALYARERKLLDFGEKYRWLVARRDSNQRELEQLKSRAADLRRALPEHEQAVDLGDLRRTTPVSRDWGFDRGRAIDRYYIERFLEDQAADIEGVVLELQDPGYAERFGGRRVTRCDVVDLDPANRRATIVSDLRSAANIASDAYDCVILTQTLHLIDDVRAVVAECARVLRPGGVLLATLPCASRVSLEYGQDGDFWRVTEAGSRKLFSEIFPLEALDVRACGNVLVNTAFLYGLACHELAEAEFEEVDPYFPLLVTVRAQKPGGPAKAGHYVQDGPAKAGHYVQDAVGRSVRLPPSREAPADRSSLGGGSRAASPVSADGNLAAVLLYHRVADPPSDIHRLATPPDEFRAQMEHLHERYHAMPLDELAAAAREGALKPGSIAVTFDDGYVDNYTEASTILSALGVPATFFLTTDRLGDVYEFWWDVLEQILLSSVAQLPATLQIELPDGTRTFTMVTPDERLTAHTAIYHAIVGVASDARDEVIQALTRWSGRKSSDRPLHRRMKPSEIQSLAARDGHTIGAHTARHLMLPRQAVEVQREEIDQSRRSLEALLDRRVRAFAYPFGAFDDDTIRAVRSASFDVAVTCEDALVRERGDALTLPRLDVAARSVTDFEEWLQARFADRVVERA